MDHLTAIGFRWRPGPDDSSADTIATIERRSTRLGAGLAIVRKIVTRYGGAVSIHPGPDNKGTIVAVDLPMSRT